LAVWREPERELLLSEFASGEFSHDEHGFRLRHAQFVSVAVQKDVGGHKASPLIAVKERMIVRDAGGVGGGQLKDVRVAVVP
jgi:hypothetical protein